MNDSTQTPTDPAPAWTPEEEGVYRSGELRLRLDPGDPRRWRVDDLRTGRLILARPFPSEEERERYGLPAAPPSTRARPSSGVTSAGRS